MHTRKVFTAGILPILMFFLVAAKRPDVSQSDFLLRTPESRVQGWRDGLLKFISEHRNLNSEQAYALQRLADFDNPSAFGHTLEPDERDLLANDLDELGRVLSFRDYVDLLRSFDGEIRVWLVRNGLASEAQSDPPYCNCGGSGDCVQGASCTDKPCMGWSGSRYFGICTFDEEQ